MAMEQFEKLNNIYSAIKEIDKIILSDSKDKLDDINVALKEINKAMFDDNIKNEIVLGYRKALLKIYTDMLGALNSNLEEPGGLVSNCIPIQRSSKEVVRIGSKEQNTTQFINEFDFDDMEAPVVRDDR